MMVALKLAYRNLIGAGLRTWLTVFVLSLSFVLIIWHWGLLDGWNAEMRNDMITWEIGGGAYWHPKYDPYDPFTLDESRAPIPAQLAEKGLPILIAQGTAYPDGRMQSVLLKGIEPGQQTLKIPTAVLDTVVDEVPALVGMHQLQSMRAKVGDVITVRWRDANGTFDAVEVRVVGTFSTVVQTVDKGQIWLPLKRLQAMVQSPNAATVVIIPPGTVAADIKGWNFHPQSEMLSEVEALIESKRFGGAILYFLLLSLSLLAIFDTQVLSVFRRQKEIGTYIAMGMTRGEVIRLFTVEGAMNAVLAVAVGAVYGIPFLAWQAEAGWTVPYETEGFGMAIAQTLYPTYSAGLVLFTIALVFCAVTIVSFLPARKIATMNPTDAIRGKVQ